MSTSDGGATLNIQVTRPEREAWEQLVTGLFDRTDPDVSRAVEALRVAIQGKARLAGRSEMVLALDATDSAVGVFPAKSGGSVPRDSRQVGRRRWICHDLGCRPGEGACSPIGCTDIRSVSQGELSDLRSRPDHPSVRVALQPALWYPRSVRPEAAALPENYCTVGTAWQQRPEPATSALLLSMQGGRAVWRRRTWPSRDTSREAVDDPRAGGVRWPTGEIRTIRGCHRLNKYVDRSKPASPSSATS